jgi:uncharacterized protein YlxW (UPF0749 family)
MTAQLDALLADAIASDYEAGQERKTGTTPIIATIAGATIVTFMIGVALADSRSNSSVNQTTKTELISRIDEADNRVASLEQQVSQANRDLQAAEQATLAGTSLGTQAQVRLDQLRIAAGFTEVSGMGVSVTLDDAISDELIPDAALQSGRVVDSDLQMVVNGLWQAGATAVSINDHRLTGASAIRSAGQAILVDYRPLVRPYKIVAIAKNADALAGRFRENQGGLLLEQLELRFGVVWELETVGQVTLPASTNQNIGGTP